MKFRGIVLVILLSACVDPFQYTAPPERFQTVIEGFVTDSPGPYTVRVSKSIGLNELSSTRSPVSGASIILFDDEGNSESFTETADGEYTTGGSMQGQVGHSYHIRVETIDGKVFESKPDKIQPAGGVDTIRYTFEERTIDKGFGPLKADVFNVFVDGHAGNGGENYVRWRFTGTYQVLTYPQLHITIALEFPYMTPYACSGYVVEPALNGGILVQREPCTCCTCWVNQFESIPMLSDGQFVNDKQFSNVKLAEIPINGATFYEKFMVRVEQMSLTREAYNFFHLVRTQKEGAASLFQPPSGEIRGNVTSLNADDAVVGIFWATSVRTKIAFIDKTEVPYLLANDVLTEPCNTFYDHSSTTQPADWQ